MQPQRDKAEIFFVRFEVGVKSLPNFSQGSVVGDIEQRPGTVFLKVCVSQGLDFLTFKFLKVLKWGREEKEEIGEVEYDICVKQEQNL